MADLTFKDFQATTVTDNAGQEVEVSIECVDVVQPEAPEEVCPSCIPNPNAIEPNWKTLKQLRIPASSLDYSGTATSTVEPINAGEPYLNEKTCEYSIVVKTHYDTGFAAMQETGENSVLDAINNPAYNQRHYLEPAIRTLLRFYDKLETDTIYEDDDVVNVGTVDALKVVTAAVEYQVPLRPMAKMSILVTIPALNFDLIESEPEEELSTPETYETTTYELPQLRGAARRVARVFKVYHRYIEEYEKEFGGGFYFEDNTKLVLANSGDGRQTGGNNERYFLKKAVTQLFDFIFSRGYKTRGRPRAGRKVATSIEIGFEANYTAISYIKIIEKGCEDNARIFSGNKLSSLTNSEPFMRPTTLGYLATIMKMNEDLLAREPSEFSEFVLRYTFPGISINYGATLPDQEDESLVACISANLNVDETMEQQLRSFIRTPEIILKRFSEKLCVSAQDAMEAGGMDNRDAGEGQNTTTGDEGDTSALEAFGIFPIFPFDKPPYGPPGSDEAGQRSMRRLWFNTAFESAMDEYYVDDPIFDELTTILDNVDGDNAREKLRDFRKEFLGKIKQCGLYSFMVRGIQCLTSGMSLTDSLFTMIESALKSMDVDGMHKLFVGLPMDAQLEIEELVKERIAQRYEENQEIYNREDGFIGGFFGTADSNPFPGTPYIITGPTTSEYQAGSGWHRVEISYGADGSLNCSPGNEPCTTAVLNNGSRGLDVSNAEAMATNPDGYFFTESEIVTLGLRTDMEAYNEWLAEYRLQQSSTFMDQIKAYGQKQSPNFVGEGVFGDIKSDIGSDLRAGDEPEKPTPTRRTLAPSRAGGAYNAAGGETIVGAIVTAYIESILEYYTTSGTIEELLRSLNKLPGAEIVFRVLKQLDCSVPPLFDPGVPDFLKSLDMAVCRSQRKLVLPNFQNPMAWLSELDPLAYLKDAILDQVEELVWSLIQALVKKMLEIISNALCKAVEVVGSMVQEAFTPGTTSLRSIVQEAICGPDATDEDIDQTISDIFNSIGAAQGTSNSDQINSLVEDMSNGLTRDEMVDLLTGQPNPTATAAAKEIIDSEHSDFSEIYNSESKISTLFSTIGNNIPAEYLYALNNLDKTGSTPFGGTSNGPLNCLSPAQKTNFDDARAALLDGKGESPTNINELVNNENEQAMKDLSDVAGIMQKGMGNFLAENMPDIMAKNNCATETGQAIIAAVPEELVMINDEVTEQMFNAVLMQFIEEMVGRKGFMSLVLSDTLGNSYPDHQQKVRNSALDSYVNEFLDSIDDDEEKENREKGYYPKTIATWLIHQILSNTATDLAGIQLAIKSAGSLIDPSMANDAEETIEYTNAQTGETFSITKPKEQKYNLRLSYVDNNDGKLDSTSGSKKSSYGFYLDYYQALLVSRSGVEFDTDPDALADAVITDDYSRVRITIHQGSDIINSLKYDFFIGGSLDRDVLDLKSTFDLREDVQVDIFDNNVNASTALSTTPQSYVFSNYVDSVITNVGLPSMSGLLRNTDFAYVTDKAMLRMLQSIAISFPDPSDSYGISQAFIYGKEVGELNDIDLVYVKPDAAVYSSNQSADDIDDEDLYDLDESLRIMGRSATDAGDGSSRVFFLDPAKYGGRYANPPLYIAPPRNTGWLAIARGIVPELDGCEPERAQLINFNDIKERVNELNQTLSDDDRLLMNPDCVTEVPYARILTKTGAAGIEGSILATIRIYVAEQMLKAMATFSKFQPIDSVIDNTFAAYIVAVIEEDLKEYGKKIGPLKDDGYWYSFLEQSVQAFGRMVENNEMEIVEGSAEDNALLAINDMQEVYVYPGRDEWLGKSRSGLLFNEAILTAALVASGLLLPGVALATGLGGALIAGSITGGMIANSVNEYMLERGFNDEFPPWYADRLEIGSKGTLKGYREAKKLLYVKNTQDSAKILLTKMVKDQMSVVAENLRDQMYLYEPKLTPKISDITKHFIGTSKMCFGSTLRTDLFDYDDPDPITNEYTDEYYAAAYNGVGDVLHVAAWAGSQDSADINSRTTRARSNPLDGLNIAQLAVADYKSTLGLGEVVDENLLEELREELQQVKEEVGRWNPDDPPPAMTTLEEKIRVLENKQEANADAVSASPFYKYDELVYGIGASDIDPEKFTFEDDVTEILENTSNTVLGGYSFDTGEFIVEKYIYVEDKIESGVTNADPLQIPVEITERADYLRGVVNLNEFQAYLEGDGATGSRFSPNNIPDVDYANGLVGGVSPVIDPDALISNYFGNLKFIYDDADIDQEVPIGIEGSIGLRWGLRLSYIPSKSYANKLESMHDGSSTSDPTGQYQGILTSENLRATATKFKAYMLEPPLVIDNSAGTAIEVNNDEIMGTADYNKTLAMSSKYLIPLVSVEMDVIDGPIGDFSIDNYDMACMVEKLAETPEFKLMFKYVFPLDRFVSIVGIYNCEGFLPSIGQITEDYRQDTYGWKDSGTSGITDPRTQGEWDSYDNRVKAGRSEWDFWDKTTFEKTKKSIRDMFLAFYNEREFDYTTEYDRKNLIELLKQMGVGGLRDERMSWHLRKRIKDRPFNSEDEECDVYKLV